MNSMFFVVLRRLRAPLILLIVIYAVAVLGLVLIPGVDANGNPWHPSFFHAFYVLSYTATTIGFGEIPYAFTDAQRLWVTVCIYLSVIGWAYAIGALLALAQDQGLRQALVTQRFGRRVRRLGEPFYIVCGYGETGTLLGRALDRLGLRFVVLEVNPVRIQELELQDLRADAPGLMADARQPTTLLLAGLQHPCCRGVIALTDDDSANLAVAVAVRLLRPAIPVLCRAQSRDTVASMEAFAADYIIDPFAKFGEYLTLAMTAPSSYRLLHWLTEVPGALLEAEVQPPQGPWVVCGYSWLGQAVVRQLDQIGLPVTIIEPDGVEDAHQVIHGLGTQVETLRRAGIEQAAGLVAGTDDDVNNLAIAVTARQLNSGLFVVLRQNLRVNGVLFDAFQANLKMVASDIIAHECLGLVTTPLLSRFLKRVKGQGEEQAEAMVARLIAAVGPESPWLWSVSLTAAEAPVLHECLDGGAMELLLDGLLQDAGDRERRLPCVALLLVRGEEEWMLPESLTGLRRDDRLLFAGTREARESQALVLLNANVRDYVYAGKDIPGGWVWQRLAGWRQTA